MILLNHHIYGYGSFAKPLILLYFRPSLQSPNEYCGLKRRRHFKEIDIGKGLWDLPGGKPDFGENLEDALKREVKEETGLDVTQYSLLKVKSYVVNVGETSVNRINIFYSVIVEQAQHIMLSEEHEEFDFFELKHLAKLTMLPEVKQVILG